VCVVWDGDERGGVVVCGVVGGCDSRREVGAGKNGVWVSEAERGGTAWRGVVVLGREVDGVKEYDGKTHDHCHY